MGTGSAGSSSTPVKVNIQKVTQISAGKDFSLAVSESKVFGWGQGLDSLTHYPTSLPVEFANANVIM